MESFITCNVVIINGILSGQELMERHPWLMKPCCTGYNISTTFHFLDKWGFYVVTAARTAADFKRN